MTIPPLVSGSLRIPHPVFLAPMAGYTDSALRTLCLEQGCGAVLTEVVNAAGLIHRSRQTWHLLETAPDEHPVGAHVYGSEPDVLARAVERIHATGRFDFVDLNCGCPVRRIVAKGAGAALIKDPAKITAIVKAMTQASPLPVTIKTRIGIEPGHPVARDLVEAAAQGGATAVFLHARYARRQHSGPPDWELLAATCARSPIPIIGNGGVEQPGDGFRMMRETGVAGFMIGRAAVGNPWLFRQVLECREGQDPSPHTLSEHRRMIDEHLRRLFEIKACENRYRNRDNRLIEQATILHFRAHVYRYLAGFRRWADLRRELNLLRNRDQLSTLVDAVFERQPGPNAPVTGGLVRVYSVPDSTLDETPDSMVQSPDETENLL